MEMSIAAKKHVLQLLIGAMSDLSRHIKRDIERGNSCINDQLYDKYAERLFYVMKDICNDYDDVSILKKPRLAYISRNKFKAD